MSFLFFALRDSQSERGPVSQVIHFNAAIRNRSHNGKSQSDVPPFGRTAIARQIVREGFGGFLLLCCSLGLGTCRAKPKWKFYALPFAFGYHSSFSQPQLFISLHRRRRHRCARHLEPGKMHIRGHPNTTFSKTFVFWFPPLSVPKMYNISPRI